MKGVMAVDNTREFDLDVRFVSGRYERVRGYEFVDTNGVLSLRISNGDKIETWVNYTVANIERWKLTTVGPR